MSIEVSQLVKTYGSQMAVDHVSFSLPKQGITGFLGPNGAGKSTTLKMITGFLRPDSGDIQVCGFAADKDPLELRRRIGYLPELNPLYTDMYVREYLGLMAEVHGIRNAGSRIEETIDITGLRPEAKKMIQQLSKGYKQRVGFAAALIHDPEVLILDEPTTGFDPNQISEIRDVIRMLGKEKTILFSSHILQEVEALCERVIIIHKGKIVADDRLPDLQSRISRKRIRLVTDKAAGSDIWQSLPTHDSQVSEDGRSWSFESEDPDALARSVMELCLSHGLKIVSLQTENGSLEDIFRDLTH